MTTTDPLLIDVPERIETARLLLRPPRPGDGTILCAAVGETLAELAPWMPWAQAAPTPQDSELQCRRMHAKFTSREDLVYFMFERAADGAEGAFVGGTGLHRIDWSVPRLEIGYWRRAGFEGRGLVAEAVRALARMAFDALGARRVEIRMDPRNACSVRVAERAGFTFEGVLRQDSVDVKGAGRDTHVYSRVRGVEEP
ncbi:MAG: GNAT family N-acetyltransferase [Ideonella sp.]|nr:GNAT family N-acetyltransferase [Ideonella sp.]